MDHGSRVTHSNGSHPLGGAEGNKASSLIARVGGFQAGRLETMKTFTADVWLCHTCSAKEAR